MPLIKLFEKSPEAIMQYNIKQIVAASGDGSLLDNSECSTELNFYLSRVSEKKLFEHIEYCLANSFEKSGQILQDIVNELGRRLEYSVENGLYQGKSSRIGFDGIWKSPDNHSLIVEIKTTDAYRINLDTLANYRSKLIESGKITNKSSILIVVGRKDTGDLEAQIRGSRHAWDVRIISTDALMKLLELKINSDEDETIDRIRSILVPFEYTRLDNIIDIVFTTAKDLESSSESKEEIDDEVMQNETSNKQDVTPKDIVESLRVNILKSIEKQQNTNLIATKKAQFSNSEKTVKVVCAISKQYKNGGYWYAYHPRYNNFLSDANFGFYALGCVGQKFAYLIPYKIINELLKEMNVTPKGDKTYWHVILTKNENENYEIWLKNGKSFDLEKYKILI